MINQCMRSTGSIDRLSCAEYHNSMEHLPTVPVVSCSELTKKECDAVVLVAEDVCRILKNFSVLSASIEAYQKIASNFSSGVHVIHCETIPSGRLVVSFTGKLDRDYDDIRRITDASRDGILRAIAIGSVNPLLALANLKTAEETKTDWANPKTLCLTSLLGALHALYVPLEVREFSARPCTSELPKPVKSNKVDSLYWFAGAHYAVNHVELARIAWSLEEGRRVARDIGGSDPERMRANHVVDYLISELANSSVKMTVDPVDSDLYPLAAVVDRGSHDRHRGSIVHLEYSGPVESEAPKVTDLFLVGKGIIYDTGGSDLKTGGAMATMHRDKCGAAAVAGFFKVASLLSPKNLNLHGSLALIRNSIGCNAYVSDEIITSRAGIRVRVNNTDAEGRMVMTDLLCEAKEKALHVPNPHLMTIATLTGHVLLSYGPNYTGIVCNGPARRAALDYLLQEAGSHVGEMHEISTLRREDYEAHNNQDEYADLLNSAPPVGGKRVRGHQSPAAFMILASGLDAHMLNSDKPLSYTHLDIAGSQGPSPGVPTAVPLLTLASLFMLSDYLPNNLRSRL